jgi:hypothetical protein
MASMRFQLLPVIAFALPLSIGSTGCSTDELDFADQGKNCGASNYTAFDPQNHADADVHLTAQGALAVLIDETIQNPSNAAATFTDVEQTYQASAGLQGEVQQLGDDHFPGDPNAKGAGSRIDTAITTAIGLGKAATTATQVAIAREVIDKSLTRFFYLAVYHGLIQGSRPAYDAAYGYLGTGRTNEPAVPSSLAATARARDVSNGTDHSERLFREIIDGACALDARLSKDHTEQIDWSSDVAYSSHVQAIDGRMTEVLALSVGHEFFTPISLADPEDAKIRLHAGAYFFFALEDKMRALGGQAQSDASAIASAINNALNAVESGDTSWQLTFDSDFIRDRVAAAFGVTIQG